MAVINCRVVSRVRIPPAQMFELMKVLERQLTAWEQETDEGEQTFRQTSRLFDHNLLKRRQNGPRRAPMSSTATTNEARIHAPANVVYVVDAPEPDPKRLTLSHHTSQRRGTARTDRHGSTSSSIGMTTDSAPAISGPGRRCSVCLLDGAAVLCA